MAIIHRSTALPLLFGLLAQILATKGRGIKPMAVKIDLQKASNNLPQTILYAKDFPSFEPVHKLQDSNLVVYSANVKIEDSDGQGDQLSPKIPSLVNDFKHTIRGRSLGAGHSKESNNKLNSKTTLERTSRTPASFLFRASTMAHENDFRPTTPGSSPGAGHADTNKYEKEESRHCLNDKCTEDFRPTTPGDSPGAGHSIIN